MPASMKSFSPRLCLLLLLLTGSHALPAQDTLRVVQYNLLHYGVAEAGCTIPSTSVKNAYLSTILSAAQPDIFGVNEMGSNALYGDNILVNVLQPMNANWERCTYTNNASSNITNMLFYRGDKLVLYDEHVINHSLRDINLYTLYYNDANLATTQDTTFLTIVIVHLKAGSTTSDENEREAQASLIMAYLAGLGNPGNLLVMGDFNLKTSSEPAYQSFLTEPNLDARLIDPINQPGGWNANAAFDLIHTQSTRSGTLADCGSSGGMDDRFDFIMANRRVMGDSNGVKYVPASYKAFGNDGNHYNTSINNGANSAVSTAVVNALYNMSDHLPVMLDLAFDVSLPASAEAQIEVAFAAFPNPVQEILNLRFESPLSGTVRVTDVAGRMMSSYRLNAQVEFLVDAAAWPAGVYFVQVQADSGASAVKRIVK